MAASLRAEELKTKGNVCFQNGDYVGAEKYYTQAIIKNSTNAAFFTNRALARLKMEAWEEVIADCHKALDILPTSLKAYTYLGQSNLALDRPNEALSSSLQAYKLAIEQRSPSAASIANTVLNSKKRRWEISEQRRIEQEGELLPLLVKRLWEGSDNEIAELKKQRSLHKHFNRNRMQGRQEHYQEKHEPGDGYAEDPEDGEETDPEWDSSFREECDAIRFATHEHEKTVQEVFARADAARFKPRVVPDYFIDSITFSFMHDPVITKHGQSYERSTILEHLRRSKTDPLTREPLSEEDLRPNLALKQACEEFLRENGWAVDY